MTGWYSSAFEEKQSDCQSPDRNGVKQSPADAKHDGDTAYNPLYDDSDEIDPDKERDLFNRGPAEL